MSHIDLLDLYNILTGSGTLYISSDACGYMDDVYDILKGYGGKLSVSSDRILDTVRTKYEKKAIYSKKEIRYIFFKKEQYPRVHK